MLDRDDLTVIGTWAVRSIAALLLLILGAGALGIAVLVFRLIVGA